MSTIRSFAEIFDGQRQKVRTEMLHQQTSADFAINLEWVADQFASHNTEPKRKSIMELVQNEMAIFEMIQQCVTGGHMPARDPESFARLDLIRPLAITLLADISVLHEFVTNLPDNIPDDVRKAVQAFAGNPSYKAIEGLATLAPVIGPIDNLIIKYIA